MPRAWISVGSNIDRRRHIRGALRDLAARFGELVVSPVYETDAVGFTGDAFFNLVVGIDSTCPPAELHRLLRAIEQRHGRERDGGKFASRTLDLDLLTYGDAVSDDGGRHLPRDEIVKYAFVLAPLADVAADERHPELGRDYGSLWHDYRATDRQGMRRLDDTAWLYADD